jgi:superfamily II DNA or RNA helicase
VADSEERVIVATGRYLGEGFDDARLDTLFLTMPISWRGTLAQYAGRLHRLHAAKREVVIYDYVDAAEPLLVKMASRREAGYRSLGYDVTYADDLFSRETAAPTRKIA